MEVTQLYKDFSEVVKDISVIHHIMVGEINSRGHAVGFHHEGDLSKGKSEVIEATRKAKDDHGIYEAGVIIFGIQKRGASSFYPSSYSPEEVLNGIKEAYNKKNRVKYRLYEATLANGIIIHFYQDEDADYGKIVTAYPKYQA
ncbi:hypothetical protein FZC84_17480 [Rossellomorea vietnamensis]|uniref:Bacterial EndoU nuclease domain-containing protein n=1 Tax=Rossellomorea vietnamensis TaxID=218284 RepID=A0A5D4M7A5_9BACI|nr:EndoU domain-containing protein [Rossellomorea vietnamensis]TYR97809.1 hypothetical protein FZC84_17480 [Rossellomorea vietnamensis]